jgi:hypothetical protein
VEVRISQFLHCIILLFFSVIYVYLNGKNTRQIAALSESLNFYL